MLLSSLIYEIRLLLRADPSIYKNFVLHIIPYFTGLTAQTRSNPVDSGNLLPESFPEGVDPSQYALPVFLQEPQDTFAARGASAILSCKAAHALKAYFTCNEEKMEGTEEDLVENGVKLKKLSIEVSKAHLGLVIGKFSCRCHASSVQGEVVSSEAVVKSACKFSNIDTPILKCLQSLENIPKC